MCSPSWHRSGPRILRGPKAAAKAPKAPKAAEKEWVVTLKRVSAERYTVALQDLQPGEPVNLLAANMRLTGENISTAKKTRGKASLSLALNGKGSVAVAGAIVLDPMSAALSVNLKNVDIGPFQPYFTDKVKMTVTEGASPHPGTRSSSSTGTTRSRPDSPGRPPSTDSRQSTRSPPKIFSSGILWPSRE